MNRMIRKNAWKTADRAESGSVRLMARFMHLIRSNMRAPIPSAIAAKATRPHQRGFTLTEMMAVVVIIGILSAIALVGYRKYLNSARSSEAAWMVNGIRAAQEAYRSETLSYLDVSQGNLSRFYPTDSPTDAKVQWGGAGNDAANWRILNVTTDGAVYYGYSCAAGPPGNFNAQNSNFTLNAPTDIIEPWYVVEAKGNVDGDNEFSYYHASSFSNEVYWLNEGE